MMIGMRPYFALPLIRRAMSKPCSSGSIASRMMRSGTWSFTRRRASRPRSASITRCPFCVSSRLSSVRISCSSSTTRTSFPAPTPIASTASAARLRRSSGEVGDARDVLPHRAELARRDLGVPGRRLDRSRPRRAARAEGTWHAGTGGRNGGALRACRRAPRRRAWEGLPELPPASERQERALRRRGRCGGGRGRGGRGGRGGRCGAGGWRAQRRRGARRGQAELTERLLGDPRPEVVLLAVRLGLVGGLDGLRERRVHRDVRVDLLAGDELELVDHALLVRVCRRQEDAVAPHEHRQDPVGLGELARDDEVIEHDGDSREVDLGTPCCSERARRASISSTLPVSTRAEASAPASPSASLRLERPSSLAAK